MRVIVSAFVLASMVLWGSAASAASMSLSGLLAGGSLSEAGFTFDSFHNFTQNGDISLDTDDILVSTISDLVNGQMEWGIRFQANWDLDDPDQSYDLGIDFTVSSVREILDNTLSVVGGGVGDYDAHVAEGVTDPLNGNVTLANKFVFFDSDPGSQDQLIDHQDFPYGVHTLDVHKDFAMHTGAAPDSQVNVSHFDQTFSVPEPSTLLMLSTFAPFAIGGLVRNRRRFVN